MKCPKCSVNLKPNSKYCGFCGINIDNYINKQNENKTGNIKQGAKFDGVTYSLEVKNKSEKIPITRDISIGSAPENTIPIENNEISKNHLKIIVKEQHCILKDLESKTGTIVNGKKIKEIILQNNDVIEIGDTIMFFKEDMKQ